MQSVAPFGIIKKGDTMYFHRIRDLREDNDRTQQEVAALLNMQRNVYRRYEQGHRELPLWAAIKLADLYRTSIDYLVGRTDDPSPPHA